MGGRDILIIAGEASGDMHGAGLVAAMQASAPDLRFFGVGGPALNERGVEILYDAAELAVVGLVEVIAHLGHIRRAIKRLDREMAARRPKLVILIDFPDFNFIIARKAKRLGIAVFYYISPQVWAWRSGRVRTLARLVDRLAVILPFEEAFFHERGVPQARFVGHPLLDEIRPVRDRRAVRAAHGVDEDTVLIGLLPGSRRREVATLLPPFLEAARVIRKKHPRTSFMLPLAPTLDRETLALPPGIEDEIGLVLVESGQRHEMMQACDAALAASGTVTLELAIMGVPMVMAYRVSPLTYAIGRRLINLEHASLVNLVAQREVIRELLQDEARSELMVRELERILPGSEGARRMGADLAEVRQRLGGEGGLRRTADLALEMIRT